MSWQYLDWRQHPQFNWGYPNYMHNVTNMMQPGLCYSSFVNPQFGKDSMNKIDKNSNTSTVAEVGNTNNVLATILQGRKPFLYCQSYCRFKKFEMKCEQVEESGPPHRPIFTFSLEVVTNVDGESLKTEGTRSSKSEAMEAAAEIVTNVAGKSLKSVGSGSSKLKAQEAAAEEMVLELYNTFGPLPPRFSEDYRFSRTRYYGEGKFPKNKKKPKATEKLDDKAWAESRANYPSQNNPISNLFEFAKRKKMVDPMFETIGENTLGYCEALHPKGRYTKMCKKEFTIKCTFMGKQFQGQGSTKKEAKLLAAKAAWDAYRPN